MSDAPIEPKDYIYGVNVVDIGDLRIARGLTRRPRSTCRHDKMVYDPQERRIWCDDCESEVEPFDAFVVLTENLYGSIKSLQQREKAVAEAEQFAARSLAVKALDAVWRSRTMVPLCPHCKEALLPEDVKNGVSSTSAEFARRRRNKSSYGDKNG